MGGLTTWHYAWALIIASLWQMLAVIRDRIAPAFAMHTKVLKIPFVRCLALRGAWLTILTSFAQAAPSGRTPSIYTAGDNLTASTQGALAFDLSATGAVSAP